MLVDGIWFYRRMERIQAGSSYRSGLQVSHRPKVIIRSDYLCSGADCQRSFQLKVALLFLRDQWTISRRGNSTNDDENGYVFIVLVHPAG